MNLQFDHAFSFVPSGAKSAIAERLRVAGFVPGPSKRHVGQGTENLVLLFHNSYFEFIWACEPGELSSDAIKRTYFKQRSQWQSTGYSPFGVAVRGVDKGGFPFSKWDYRPPYLTPGMSIVVAELPRIELPMIFFPTHGRPPAERGEQVQPFLQHPNGAIAIKEIEISVTKKITEDLNVSDREILSTFCEGIHVKMKFNSDDHLMRITIDDGDKGRLDFRPIIPVVIHW